MKYLYDVWVNWFEGEEYGYNVCDYHEWRKTDQIDILEQVPVLYIEKKLYNYIENSLYDLPDGLLEDIHKRAYVRKGVSRRVLDYACIMTDGEKILAINTIGFHIPLQKSRIIPRQEQQVLEYCKQTKPKHFSYVPITEQTQATPVLKMEEHHVIGLTRRERQLKKLLFIALDKLKFTDNRNEIMYWLTEWDVQMADEISDDMLINDVWTLLYQSVETGWSEAHECLCEQMIKGNEFLEKYWELEHEYRHNPAHK